tara:strand:- start:408 stop:749 length:342 start_codon:yes stop_codon:yes gene_type:complete
MVTPINPTEPLIIVEDDDSFPGESSHRGGEYMTKNESKKTPEVMENNILVGYVRRSNAGGALKLSVNTAAFADCSTYMTSDGQSYVPLVISMAALQKVLSGERAVTTVTQLHD